MTEETSTFDPNEFEIRKRLPAGWPRRKNDIYVTRRTDVNAQLARARKLVEASSGFDELFVHGLGMAINRAINLALNLKRASLGTLEIAAATSTVEVSDELWPLVDDLEPRSRSRKVSAVHVRVFRATGGSA